MIQTPGSETDAHPFVAMGRFAGDVTSGNCGGGIAAGRRDGSRATGGSRVVQGAADGKRRAVWGLGREAHTPRPTLFVLASTINETLGQTYYRQSGTSWPIRDISAYRLILPSRRRLGEETPTSRKV